MGTSTGYLRDPVARRPGDDVMGRSVTFPGRLSYIFFKFNYSEL